MKRHGRRVLGAFSGFFFGLGVALLLLVLGQISLDSKVVIALPLALLVLGVAWAWAAPMGGSAPPEKPAADGPAPA